MSVQVLWVGMELVDGPESLVPPGTHLKYHAETFHPFYVQRIANSLNFDDAAPPRGTIYLVSCSFAPMRFDLEYVAFRELTAAPQVLLYGFRDV